MSSWMKNKIVKGTKKVGSAAGARPAETRCSLIGATIGALLVF